VAIRYLVLGDLKAKNQIENYTLLGDFLKSDLEQIN
jgi:hypothetical protein